MTISTRAIMSLNRTFTLRHTFEVVFGNVENKIVIRIMGPQTLPVAKFQPNQGTFLSCRHFEFAILKII